MGLRIDSSNQKESSWVVDCSITQDYNVLLGITRAIKNIMTYHDTLLQSITCYYTVSLYHVLQCRMSCHPMVPVQTCTTVPCVFCEWKCFKLSLNIFECFECLGMFMYVPTQGVRKVRAHGCTEEPSEEIALDSMPGTLQCMLRRQNSKTGTSCGDVESRWV